MTRKNDKQIGLVHMDKCVFDSPMLHGFVLGRKQESFPTGKSWEGIDVTIESENRTRITKMKEEHFIDLNIIFIIKINNFHTSFGFL